MTAVFFAHHDVATWGLPSWRSVVNDMRSASVPDPVRGLDDLNETMLLELISCISRYHPNAINNGLRQSLARFAVGELYSGLIAHHLTTAFRNQLKSPDKVMLFISAEQTEGQFVANITVDTKIVVAVVLANKHFMCVTFRLGRHGDDISIGVYDGFGIAAPEEWIALGWHAPRDYIPTGLASGFGGPAIRDLLDVADPALMPYRKPTSPKPDDESSCGPWSFWVAWRLLDSMTHGLADEYSDMHALSTYWSTVSISQVVLTLATWISGWR
ncbi:uncharacterized protein AB675_7881 [Cyphellophora attinorum]|uniref:Uncharacterized protein n=1 Tax=Cyphellophora attinorum TaxID=1664694 RepID=A0A0N1P1Q2_9EURO|nr:uncharacterized protein AB675_7881 [Phialophora attinorum]KPI41123.1 hypothetical protein AB675_7881 [Phialophora attinorum]